MATTSSSRSRIEVKSGRITSIPGWWSSGKRTPQSTTSSLPWYSKTVMLRPISPRPPRGVTRRTPRARRGGDFRFLVWAGCTRSILPESGPIGPDSGRIDLVHPAQTKNLKSPPRLARGVLRVTPLGGLGEIGRNMTVFEYQGKLLVVDCGVLFPEDHQPGIDVILPDFTSIRDRLDDVVAIVLTHGHEDHIGGVPYLLKERADIPVIGSELTLAFLTAKLKEHRIRPQTVHVEAGDRHQAGPFDLEFAAVNHSIPDGLAVAIRAGAALVLHTGDFKMDQFPLDNRITDLRAFARWGQEGVDLFMVDSTMN